MRLKLFHNLSIPAGVDSEMLYLIICYLYFAFTENFIHAVNVSVYAMELLFKIKVKKQLKSCKLRLPMRAQAFINTRNYW